MNSPGTSGRRVTVAEVAARANVSRQTVSNAVNRPEVLRPETLAHVRQVIADLGYRPLPAARQLRSGRSRTLAFAMPVTADSASGIVHRFLHALTTAAQQREQRLLLFAAGSDEQDIGQYEDLLEGRVVDAFVLADTHHDDARTAWLAAHGARFATFGRPWGAPSDQTHDWADVDGAAGTLAAVEHLAGLGHRRIAFIGWPAGSGVGDDRRAGWRDAAMRMRLDTTDLDRGVPNTPDDGAAAASAVISAGATALVCASDTLAVGALGVARETGAAVVGFDDTAVAEAMSLSSIAQPLRESAEWVVDRLLGPPTDEPRHVLLAPTLVPRASSLPASVR